MPTNRNDYDTRPSWALPQNQPYTSQFATPYDGRQPLPRQHNPVQAQRPGNQKPKALEKMPKARAMALANKLKRGLAIASFVGFGTFGGLVALHQVGTTSTGSSSSKSTNSSSSSSQNSNTFLNQQGGNTNGTSTPTTSSSSSSTVTGTSTS
jgi:hypothetical protein